MKLVFSLPTLNLVVSNIKYLSNVIDQQMLRHLLREGNVTVIKTFIYELY